MRIYFDGLCEPVNPGGTCAWGVVIYDDDGEEACAEQGTLQIEDRKYATNNVAEWSAFIYALRWLRDNTEVRPGHVTICGDSQLVVKQFVGAWVCKAPHLQQALQTAREIQLELQKQGIDIGVKWVPRDDNERADALSKEAYEMATGRKAPRDNAHHKRRGPKRKPRRGRQH